MKTSERLSKTFYKGSHNSWWFVQPLVSPLIYQLFKYLLSLPNMVPRFLCPTPQSVWCKLSVKGISISSLLSSTMYEIFNIFNFLYYVHFTNSDTEHLHRRLMETRMRQRKSTTPFSFYSCKTTDPSLKGIQRDTNSNGPPNSIPLYSILYIVKYIGWR